MSSRRNQQRRRLAGRRATRAHTYVKAAEKFAALVVIRTGGRHRRRDIGRSAASVRITSWMRRGGGRSGSTTAAWCSLTSAISPLADAISRNSRRLWGSVPADPDALRVRRLPPIV